MPCMIPCTINGTRLEVLALEVDVVLLERGAQLGVGQRAAPCVHGRVCVCRCLEGIKSMRE